LNHEKNHHVRYVAIKAIERFVVVGLGEEEAILEYS
jgi:hypothetical protein